MVSVTSLVISDDAPGEPPAPPAKPIRKSAGQSAGPSAGKPAHTHHLGHRERLRQRAKVGGFIALPDYELLELYLFRTFPRGDVKPLAKALLARFGSLGAVLGATIEEIATVPGVGEAAAIDIKLLHEATLRAGRDKIVKRPVISSWSALLGYVRVALANEPREQFRVLFLDKKNQLIADEVMNRGTVDHAPVYPREVMRRALELLQQQHHRPPQPPVRGPDAVTPRHRHDQADRRGRQSPEDRRPRPPGGRPRRRGELSGAGAAVSA
jgi:DNA repair protein RadC